MAATKHIRSNPPAPRVGGWRTGGSGENYAIESLLQQAAALGLRAPELTVVFAERAASLAEAAGSDRLWVRAESLVVSARVRLGLRADTTGRAVAALRAAEDLGEPVLAAGLRTDLAVCARSVGVPLTGLAALRPMLGITAFTGAGKAAALCQLVGCLSQFGRKPELDRTLTEADRLCGSDDELDGDDRLLTRAVVRVGISAHRRRHADVMGAADAARMGLGLLEQLDDPSRDGGVVRVRLILQLVCSLLDRGDTKNAAELAESVLTESARAASVAPLGWLRMAVATRILLPSGSVEAAAVVLRDAVHLTERHGLHALTSRLWAELAYVEERLGRESEAIECLHQSRAAEHIYGRSRRQATGLLAGEFGNGGHAPLDLDDVLGASPQSTPLVGSAGNTAFPGRYGEAVSPRATEAGTRHAERPASQGGPERDGAEHTMIIPRIVERSPASEPARSSTSGSDGRSAGTSRHAGETRNPEEAGQASETRHVSQTRPTGQNRQTRETRVEETSASSVSEQRRATEAAAHEAKLAPIRVERPVVPDLPLAPPPADEPAPRVSLVFEPKPEAAAKAEEPDAESAEVLDAAAKAEEPDAEQSKPKTRHDAAHGSVAARSVLDRLGISAGSGGGRRRAADDSGEPTSDTKPDTPDEPAESSPADTSARVESTSPAQSRAVESSESSVSEPVEETEREVEDTPLAINDPWLPRLRLPPSLEPFEDFADGVQNSMSETHFTSTPVIEDDGLGDPFRSEYDGSSPLDDDLPADAGLADLLARALAEHQAGTSSAAALVKRLGNNQGSEDRRTVNGHSRNGEQPANGRHREGSER